MKTGSLKPPNTSLHQTFHSYLKKSQHPTAVYMHNNFTNCFLQLPSQHNGFKFNHLVSSFSFCSHLSLQCKCTRTCRFTGNLHHHCSTSNHCCSSTNHRISSSNHSCSTSNHHCSTSNYRCSTRFSCSATSISDYTSTSSYSNFITGSKSCTSKQPGNSASTTTTKPAHFSSICLTTTCITSTSTGFTTSRTSFTTTCTSISSSGTNFTTTCTSFITSSTSAYTNKFTTSSSTGSCQAQEKAQTQKASPCPSSSTNSPEPSISSSYNRFPGHSSSTIAKHEWRKCLESAGRKSRYVGQYRTGNPLPVDYDSLKFMSLMISQLYRPEQIHFSPYIPTH